MTNNFVMSNHLQMVQKCTLAFFPSDAFVASARSFNMFKSMLQLGLIDELIHAKAVAVPAAKVNWWRTDT